MKLHRIELKNLNSLYGDHEIDLTNRLKDAPVFLINGPTGSGKSTLMDAVSLALFGQTPRLSRQRGRDETDSRQIMSYGTADCLAAVEFSKREPDGVRRRYRAEWSCHRARNRADGQLQEPERALYRIDADGTRSLLVSTKLAKVSDPVFKKVLEGLTVEEFQRTILLAQGEFAAFLKADEDQRANMLERLTNTDIYQRFGKRAADLKRLKEAELKRLSDQYGTLSPLSGAEVTELETRLEQTRQDIQVDTAQVERLRLAEQWLELEGSLTAAVETARLGLERADLALVARAEDAARLAEDERCRPARGVWRDLQRATAEVTGLEAELPGLTAREQALKDAVSAARSAFDEALSRKEERAQTLEAARPGLQEARRLRQAWQAATETKRAAETRAGETTRREISAREGLEAAEHRRLEAAATLEAAQAHLHTLSHASPLAQQLAGLEARFERLEADRRQLEAGQLQARTRSGALDGLRQQLSLAADALAREEAAVARYEQVVHQARQALEVQLAGAATARERREALQEELEALNTRMQSLKEAARLAQAKLELEQTIRDADAEITRRERRSLEIGDTIRAEQTRRPVLEERIRTLEEQRGLTRLALRLSDERAALRPGHPCPLCGSLDHPLAASTGLEAGDRELRQRAQALERSFETSRTELTALDQAIERLERERVALESARESQVRQRLESTTRRDRLDVELRQALEAAGLPESAGETALAQARRALQASLETVRADQRALDDAEGSFQKQEKELLRRREAIVAHRREQTGLESDLAGGKKALETLEANLEQRRGEITRESAALRAALEAAGLTVPGPDETPDLAAALRQASALVERFKEANGRLEAAAQALREAAGARDVAAVRLEEARSASATATHELETHRGEVAQAEAAATGALGGADPDGMERSLVGAVREAEAALESARAGQLEAERRLADVAATSRSMQARLEERRAARAGLLTRLVAQLAALDLPDGEALEARLLEDEMRATLTREVRALEEGRTVAGARLAEAADRLEQHRAARPVLATEDGESWSLEALREARAAGARRLAELQKTAGALQDRLEEHRKKAATLAELGQKLELARREFELWKQLHEVIGVGDGKRFKTFAQILNLQDLIDRANIRLEQLAPRYALTIARDGEGEPRLSFAVSDAHHAGSERPLTTLSGGETFLVSLALALALADYRTVQMPIETLLLDEGFGTLDADTLNTAMDALERLRSRNPNCQIGIISHVEGLSERVEARILVGKLGNGRSDIRLEFGGVAV